MASEKISEGKSIYGGYYAEDSKGNIGRGDSKESARQALGSAQQQSQSNQKK